MEENLLLRTLRTQAWERAKGELNAVLAAFVSEVSERRGQFDDLHSRIHAFIDEVEREGLQE